MIFDGLELQQAAMQDQRQGVERETAAADHRQGERDARGLSDRSGEGDRDGRDAGIEPIDAHDSPAHV